MKILETHKTPYLAKAIRLSDYAVGIFNTIPSKAGIKKALKKGLILVNGKRGLSSIFINGDETIELLQDESVFKKNIDLKLEVLWEDDYLAVVYKPAGILVSGNKAKTIANALPSNLIPSPQTDAVHPQPIHRLDFATSGLLLIGKTAKSITELGKLFEQKKIQKTYIAVTMGKSIDNTFIDLPIENKDSKSHYQVIQSTASERFDYLNLVELKPFTGRRHQLRIHCAHIGNPILGDTEYGINGKILKGKGLFLHAKSLEFNHPFTNALIIVTKDIPKKFNSLFV
ncbi:RluA family pseudouridine synthase [Wenyingzhuangia sp. IMCC45533]